MAVIGFIRGGKPIDKNFNSTNKTEILLKVAFVLLFVSKCKVG
jgi:hypothetical protein